MMFKFIEFKRFNMLGKNRYKLILFYGLFILCWDFKFYGNILKK